MVVAVEMGNGNGQKNDEQEKGEVAGLIGLFLPQLFLPKSDVGMVVAVVTGNGNGQKKDEQKNGELSGLDRVVSAPIVSAKVRCWDGCGDGDREWD